MWSEICRVKRAAAKAAAFYYKAGGRRSNSRGPCFVRPLLPLRSPRRPAADETARSAVSGPAKPGLGFAGAEEDGLPYPIASPFMNRLYTLRLSCPHSSP